MTGFVLLSKFSASFPHIVKTTWNFNNMSLLLIVHKNWWWQTNVYFFNISFFLLIVYYGYDQVLLTAPPELSTRVSSLFFSNFPVLLAVSSWRSAADLHTPIKSENRKYFSWILDSIQYKMCSYFTYYKCECLSLFHAKTTERIRIKFSTHTDYILEYHIVHFPPFLPVPRFRGINFLIPRERRSDFVEWLHLWLTK